MAKTIAVAGKGGTGKTTIAGMLIKYLVSNDRKPVLAVDADSNANLNEVLGLDVAETLGNAREEMKKGIVPGGMTHWQHPRFFAYFNANAAPASMIAENLASVMAAQCMLWQTSPAATEIETRMVDWMRQALGLPAAFRGVIQDSATSANQP